MSDLGKTLGLAADLGLAASLYGVERLLRLGRPQDGPTSVDDPASEDAPSSEDDSTSADLGHGLSALSSAVRDQLGPLARAVCRAGEDLRVAAPELWRRRDGSEAAELASPLARQELRNRLEVYRQVAESRESTRELPSDLSAAAERVLVQAPHRRLWSWESLGYAHGRRALERSSEPRDLLASTATLASGRTPSRASGRTPSRAATSKAAAARVLPEEALPMLHAGMGLAFAEACLRPLGPASSMAATRTALDRFLRLCRRNARSDQEVGAWDSLGFVVRHQRPELLGPCTAALHRLGDERLEGFFWHGVGRAICFLPMHFLPGLSSAHHGLGTVLREIPPGPARHQALAGFGLATTLTHLRHPRILERAIEELGRTASPSHPGDGDDPGGGDDPRAVGEGFEEGVESALLIRGALIPDPAALEVLHRHRPAEGRQEAWRRWILEPAERATARPPRVDGAGPFLALNRRLVAAAAARAEVP